MEKFTYVIFIQVRKYTALYSLYFYLRDSALFVNLLASHNTGNTISQEFNPAGPIATPRTTTPSKYLQYLFLGNK